MPDPIANVFQTTLLIMYFVTPITKTVDHMDAKQKKQYEAKQIWTLQSTNQIPTENPNMCVAIGTELIRQFVDVSSVTVRAYCLCPEKVITNDACFNKRSAEDRMVTQGLLPSGPRATIVPLGPNSLVPKPPGPAKE